MNPKTNQTHNGGDCWLRVGWGVGYICATAVRMRDHLRPRGVLSACDLFNNLEETSCFLLITREL